MPKSCEFEGSLLMQPLGYALVGPAVAAFGQTGTLWIAAAETFASCIATLAVPSIRQLTVERSDPSVPLAVAAAGSQPSDSADADSWTAPGSVDT